MNLIPTTFQEVRDLVNVRIFEWNEDCVKLVQDMIDSGRECDIQGSVDEFALRVQAIVAETEDPRTMSAIGKVAKVFGANVSSF